MTDESGQTYPFTVDALLDRATGPEGYYGAFVANMHTDSASSAGATAIVSSALARGVPVVSSRQMLTWLDGRNASSFGSLAYSGGTMSFTIAPGVGANGLRALLPASTPDGPITGLTLDGSPVPFTVEVVKGIEYARFDAAAGSYEATYVADTTGPVITDVQADPNRRHRRRDVDDRRAVQLARRLRHEPRLAHVFGHVAGHDDEPQRDPDGPRGGHDVPLPRDLDRRVGELHDGADGDAADVHDVAREAGRHDGGRLRRGDARLRARTSPRPGTARSCSRRPWGASSVARPCRRAGRAHPGTPEARRQWRTGSSPSTARCSRPTRSSAPGRALEFEAAIDGEAFQHAGSEPT